MDLLGRVCHLFGSERGHHLGMKKPSMRLSVVSRLVELRRVRILVEKTQRHVILVLAFLGVVSAIGAIAVRPTQRICVSYLCSDSPVPSVVAFFWFHQQFWFHTLLELSESFFILIPLLTVLRKMRIDWGKRRMTPALRKFVILNFIGGATIYALLQFMNVLDTWNHSRGIPYPYLSDVFSWLTSYPFPHFFSLVAFGGFFSAAVLACFLWGLKGILSFAAPTLLLSQVALAFAWLPVMTEHVTNFLTLSLLKGGGIGFVPLNDIEATTVTIIPLFSNWVVLVISLALTVAGILLRASPSSPTGNEMNRT